MALFSQALWLIPLLYLFILPGAQLVSNQKIETLNRAWLLAKLLSGAALLLAMAFFVGAVSFFAISGSNTYLLKGIMLLLISFLGHLIIRFSSNYLVGEKSQDLYLAAMSSVLVAVSVVSMTENLGIMILSWMATSIGLHFLLTFYNDRRGALLAAHKKFIASRIAECCLIASLGLIFLEVHSLDLDTITSTVNGFDKLPNSLHFAAVLLVIAVLFKTAQLPVHGWLMQVMEAPTPVSALLHAGVINLGGFVLIRTAALLSAAPIAQTLLIVFGTLTTVLSGIVMLTRVSIKVRLAWSTCSQMGFMLVECALGLYDLALLHLVAHSLYKAYCFLSAGDTVLLTRKKKMLSAFKRESSYQVVFAELLAAPLAIALMMMTTAFWQMMLPGFHLAFIAQLIIGIGAAPFLWPSSQIGWASLARSCVSVLAIAHLYILWHLVFGAIVPSVSHNIPTVFTLFVGISFLALYVLQVWLTTFPFGRISKTLYPLVYAGFYLDELFTRVTFLIYPPDKESSVRGRDSFSKLHFFTADQV